MAAFFESEMRLVALLGAVMRWTGTPFRPNSQVCQVGASCTGAVVGVLEDAGFDVPPFESNLPAWSRHQTVSLMETWLDARPELVLAVAGGREAIRPGDVVGFKVGHCIHHLGLILPAGTFFQCNQGMGACVLSQAEREFGRRLSRVWRPLEVS